jgi:hypothetical protein
MNAQTHSTRRAVARIGLCSLLALFAIALPAGNAALAQVRPAYVKNVDEPGRLPYQQMREFNPCPGQFCQIAFNPVPAGKRLVVERLTMLLGVVNTGAPNFVTFGSGAVTNGGNRAIVEPSFVRSSAVASVNFWALDREVRVYYGPGEIPEVKVAATANFSFVGNMSLHGYLIDASN